MRWLNYHHLGYFRAVAKAGGVGAAARELRVAPSTLSTQIKQLEASLGQPLFRRTGRGLAPTPFGERVLTYADRIFDVGEALMREVETGHTQPLRVGVVDQLPKGTAQRVLGPVVRAGVGLVLREGSAEALFSAQQAQEFDLTLLDAPLAKADRIPGARQVRLLDEPSMVWAAPELAARARAVWPQGLAELPWVLPSRDTAVRRRFDHWTHAEGWALEPVVTSSDRSMALAFAQAGVGLCVAPLDASVPSGLQVVSDLPTVRETTYAVVLPRATPHPGLARLGLS